MFGREEPVLTDSTAEVRKIETRQRILDTTLALIRERGIDKVSWRSIARAVNYSPAGLYEYFDNKDAITAGIARDGLAILAAALASVERAQGAEERLIAMGKAYVRFAHEHPGYFDLVFRVLPSGRRSPEEPPSGAFALVREVMAEGVQNGIFVSQGALEEETMAYGFWGLAHGVASLQITSLKGFKTDFQRADEEVFRAYVRGLKRKRTQH